MLEDAKKLNYGSLRTMVRNWLNRNDLADDIIKDFVSLAERKIFRQLRCPMNEKAWVPKPIEVVSDSIILPGDLLEIKDLNVNGHDFRFKPYNIWISKKDCYTYTRVLGTIYFSSPLTVGTQMIMNYYFDPSGMNDDDESNNVLRTCPDLYLYASLIQAESFLINDERIALWKGLYDVTLEEVNKGYRNLDYRGNLVIME